MNKNIIRSISIILCLVLSITSSILYIQNEEKKQIIGSLVLTDLDQTNFFLSDVDRMIEKGSLTEDELYFIHTMCYSVGDSVNPISQYMKHEYLSEINKLTYDSNADENTLKTIQVINERLGLLIEDVLDIGTEVIEESSSGEPLKVSGNLKGFYEVYDFDSAMYRYIVNKVEILKKDLN